MRLKDVNELKSLYVGKTYNKLTIVDVYRLDKKWMVKCTCECGNSCDKQLGKVVSGHTKTCSGRIHKLEQNANNSQLYKDNPDIKSIVYYCDRREYDQRSIGHLMDSSAMNGLGHVYTINGGSSFMNYWVNKVCIGDKVWHKAGDYANREPARLKLVMNAMRDGNCISVKNPGSYTNIFVRTGYHLEGMKVVQDS